MRRSLQENGWRKDPFLRALCAAFLQCRTLDEIASFLRDVATLYEMQALSTRLEAARLIRKRIPYREIVERTGLSTATVTRVAAFLRNGTGYKNVLKTSPHQPSPPRLRSGLRPASHHHLQPSARRGWRGARAAA